MIFMPTGEHITPHSCCDKNPKF